jgi:hypothetical protein
VCAPGYAGRSVHGYAPRWAYDRSALSSGGLTLDLSSGVPMRAACAMFLEPSTPEPSTRTSERSASTTAVRRLRRDTGDDTGISMSAAFLMAHVMWTLRNCELRVCLGSTVSL